MIIFIIMLIVGVLALFLSTTSPHFNYIGDYHLRKCQGRAWKAAFPNADKEDIRQFLDCLKDEMDFDYIDRLKFKPEDELITIYRSQYGGKTPFHDDMECERFFMNLCDKFQLDDKRFADYWKDEFVTLRTLFSAILTLKS